MTLKAGDSVKITDEIIAKQLGEFSSEIEFKIYIFDKILNPDEKTDLVLIKPKGIYTSKINNIGGYYGNKYISCFYLDETSFDIFKTKSKLFEKSNFGELFIWISESCLSPIQNKINKSDGCFCIHCHNFSPYAENNYGEKFLCWGCNVPMNKTIYGLD